MDIEDYKQRKQEKLDRYTELAKKAQDRSDGAYNASNKKSIDEGKKAEYYQQRAANIENPNAIRSDDPEAIEKLKAKLAELEAIQIKWKAINAAHKAFIKNPASLDNAPFSDEIKAKIRAYVPRYSWEPHPIAPFSISNNNANMKRIKERIAHLEGIKAVAEIDETINGIRVLIDKYENRVKVVFPGIPSEAIRSELKHNGFRWSPMAGAWLAYINQWNLDTARRIAKGPSEETLKEGSDSQEVSA